MALLDDLNLLSSMGLEEEIAQGTVKRIAEALPELTDHSPGSPHVVIAEAVAWATSLLMYYVQQQPALIEEHLLRALYHATPKPALNAQAQLQLTFSTPAPLGGRILNGGLTFTGGGATWTLLDTYVYPAGTTGDETVSDEGRTSYAHLLPVVCDAPGSAYNTAAGTITAPGQLVAGLVSVTNPQAAAGGADEETYAEMRDRSFQRRSDDNLLILPLDYERAVYRYLGPGARVHVLTPPPTAGYAHLSVLMPDGSPLVAHAGLLQHLNDRSPMAPVRWVPPTVTTVQVHGWVEFDPALTTEAQMQADALTTLRTLIHPQTWGGWGTEDNTLYKSAVIAVLQRITGVKSVTLTSPDDLFLGQPHAVPVLGTVSLREPPVAAT